LTTNRSDLGGAGIQNSAVAFGGASGPSLTCTEEYDGTTWSTGGALPEVLTQIAGAGNNRGSALSIGCSATSYEYNGTLFTYATGSVTAV